jgi:L-ascorbate metabolism protein UlaG (beta-lactamase superfamily)
MNIHWYGHAAFLIRTGDVRIILDPFRSPDSGGYLPIDEPADVVVVSHENDRYHSHLGQVVPPFEVVRAMELPEGGREASGIRFEAIRVFESPEKLDGDEVAIVHFRSEGLHVVFLGDLGHSLDEAELATIRGADVVLVPAGGPPTIDFPLVAPLIEAIAPRIVVPMHYKTPRINLNIQPVERFFEALPDWPVERMHTTEFDVTRASLPDGRRIVWLDPSR